MGKTACPAELTLDLIAGRWKPMVIYWLLKGPRRFNELQRDLGDITHRTLTKQLREMERDGLVLRRDHAEIPPRVDYRLTPLGRSLEPVLIAMHDWALAHAATRTAPDRRQETVRPAEDPGTKDAGPTLPSHELEDRGASGAA